MKKIFLILFIINSLYTYSQSDEIKLDKKYFLLGVINTIYNTGPDLDTKNNPIDWFYSSDNPTLEYINREIKSDSVIDIKIEENKLFSKYLSDEIPKYFDGEHLDYSKFKTESDILSFLTGAYLRDGEKLNDTIYKIHIPLSKKPALCRDLLNKTSSKNVFFRIVQNIPTQLMVYFTPNENLIKYFDVVKNEPKRVEKIKSYLIHNLEEEVKSQKNKKKRKEYSELLSKFKGTFDENVFESNKKEIDTIQKLMNQIVIKS
ncbi:hypothetical protein [Mariniflexile sp.]|uniref:hypothetical protein n=1 Tax=Mariniflexile sp. TaxID=1979402 RepID=UPI0040480AFE